MPVIDQTNAQTDWFDLRDFVDRVCFTIIGNLVLGGSGVIVIDYSNNPAASKGTDYVTDAETYASGTQAVGPREIPPAIAQFMRFRRTGTYTSGSAAIGFSYGKGSGGRMVPVSGQSNNS